MNVLMNPKHFRQGTKFKSHLCNFFLLNGGLGDYINHMSAILWIAKECPHVEGWVFVSQPFLDVAKYLLKDFSHFQCFDIKDYERKLVNGSLILKPAPALHVNPTGAHLLDLGFMYYTQMDKAPDGFDYLPEIDYEISLSKFGISEHREFAVFTPGATADIRAIPAKHFNALVDYVYKLGIEPVFLGKRVFTKNHDQNKVGYQAKINDEYDFSRGLDLTEKTTLLEATGIMAQAKFVVGLDNGLLHFAGTTRVPIIFGHNVASIRHRQIRRKSGLTIDITVDQKLLSCMGCQSKMRFMFNDDKKGHKFSKCIYDDKACLDLLFHNNGEAWKAAIDRILLRG